MKIIIGLGNPGKEYEETRHNAGRDTLVRFANAMKFPPFVLDKKAKALVAQKNIGKEKVLLVLPETFMNKSGTSAMTLIKPKKDLREIVVVHDDLDIPVGKMKISYGKNSGGHKGVESVMRALRTKNFVRVRIGVCPKQKPNHKELMKFIVGKRKPAEVLLFKKSQKNAVKVLELLIAEPLETAMSKARQSIHSKN